MILIVSDTDYILGDINFDMIIDIIDIVLIIDILLNFSHMVNTADYNQDNQVNIIDVVQIVGHIINN